MRSVGVTSEARAAASPRSESEIMEQTTHHNTRAAALDEAGVHPSTMGAQRASRGVARLIQTAVGLAFVGLASLVTTSAGCGGDGGSGGAGGAPVFCEGGFVRVVDGEDVCEGKCEQAKCGDGYACVDNKCALLCAVHAECGDGLSQECVSVKEDETAKDIAICQATAEGSVGIKCPNNTECDGVFACPDGKKCDPACVGDACPCAADKCQPLFCRTTGVGDADAFCTLRDCHADSECPGGFWCATTRDPHQICGTTKGNNDSCGKTTDACVDPAQNEANGTTYAEGSICALRTECRVRRQCAPCETDLDCSVIAGQRCKQLADEKVCVRDCRSDGDCEAGFKCEESSCIPRFGACVGAGNFCEPCRNDLDCGDKDSGKACVSWGGSERMCIDVTLSKSCTTDNDCPAAPDGTHGLCADEGNIGATSSDDVYHKCYFPSHFNAGAGRISCWCSNPGTSCFTAGDCCSGKCVGANVALEIPGVCCGQAGVACIIGADCCSKKCTNGTCE